jgi:hypothetical protein
VNEVDWLAFWGALTGMVLYLLVVVGVLVCLFLPFLAMDPL